MSCSATSTRSIAAWSVSSGKYQAITQALRRIEGRLVDERTRREMLERDLATLRENIAMLTARIADIEQRLRSSS